MPEYLAPAVYVEETSFRAKSIEGVSTSTTGFVGPTRKGPVDGLPELITSYGDFERIYGGFADLDFQNGTPLQNRNYIAHAVKNYFDNGGSRLFVGRVFVRRTANNTGIATSADIGGGATADSFRFVARTPGGVGNGTATISLNAAEVPNLRALERAPNGSVIYSPAATYTRIGETWEDAAAVGTPITSAALRTLLDANEGRLITVNVLFRDGDRNETFFDDLGLTADHPRGIGNVLAAEPTRRIDQLENTYAIDIGGNLTGAGLLAILTGLRLDAVNAGGGAVAAPIPLANVEGALAPVPIAGGNDGALPAAVAYTGPAPGAAVTQPLAEFSRIEDISIVAAPGYSAYPAREAIQDALITHAERRRAYRFAVLDMPIDQTPNQTLTVKASIDSSYAAIYHPWVVVANPNALPNDETIPREVALPPSGFVCGIYARNDNTKGVAKSPGNEIVRGALRFQTDIGFAEQELMNPRGVNCLRSFPGRGHRLWGSRTTSSDPEWKYIGPRRYFLYLEHSIDRSTQWAVFENNGPVLWANIRETVSGFLYNEWRNNSLLGTTPEHAFFVRCDRTTMTQNDLDNGRLVCLIGVAVLKPAEFVIFRIGQKTADAS